MIITVGVLLILQVDSAAVPKIDFYAEYSRWSGLTAWFSVGQDRQTLRLALDLSSTSSHRIRSESCPPFVECYKDGRPSSWLSWIRGMESEKVEVHVPGTNRGSLYLVPRLSKKRATMRLRDVGGYIGFGPQSRFLRDKILVLSERRFPPSDKVLVHVLEMEAMPMSRRRAIGFYGASHDSWSFTSDLVLNDRFTIKHKEVKIQLEHDGLVFPHSFEASVMDYIRASLGRSNVEIVEESDKTHRLSVPCDLVNELDIDLVVTDERRIRLDGDTLVLRRHGSKGDQCLLRVSFQADVSTVVIGRILLESVSKLYLCYRAHIVAFELHGGSVLPWSSVPRMPNLLVPSFDLPLFTDNSIVLRQEPAEWDTGLVLQGWEPETFHDTQKCWLFSRLGVESYDEGKWVNTVVQEDAKLMPPSIVDGDLVFTTNPAGEERPSRVIVLANSQVVYVCEEELGEKQAKEVIECPICLGTIRKPITCGTCRKNFHPACIEAWRRRSDSCPNCRQSFDVTRSANPGSASRIS